MVPKICSVAECTRPYRARGYCLSHYKKFRVYETPCEWPITPLPDRLWARIDRRADDKCWPWTGKVNGSGYGIIGLGRRSEGKSAVHRVAYEIAIGPIPDGHQLDHTCHNDTECFGGGDCEHRRCCNPKHLEPVTQQINVARGNAGLWQTFKTHCPKGHEYTPENTFSNNGGRGCKTCRRDWNRKYNSRKRAA